MKGSKSRAAPLSGQVRTRRVRTKRERMILVAPPGFGPWPGSGTRGSGLLEVKKPMGKRGEREGRPCDVGRRATGTPTEQAGVGR